MASEEIDRANEEAVEETSPPPRTPKPRTSTRKPNGVAAAPSNGNSTARSESKWTSREAELMWPEIIDWLAANGHSPYEVEIQVVRLSPTNGEGTMTLGRIDGNAVMGDQQVAPGDRLMQVIIDQFHMPTMRGPARYEVRFLWKVGAQRIGIGILNVPSPAEIIALRNAAYAASTEQQPPQQGMGAPQRHPQQQPPQYAPPQYPPQQPWPTPPWMQHSPYGYGQPPYMSQPPPGVHPEPGVSPDVATLSAALARSQGMLDEVMRAWREGRQPPAAPGVAAAPPSEEAIAEKVTARVLMALQKAGAFSSGGLSGAPAAVAAPAAATPAATRNMMDDMFNGVMQTALGVFKSGLEKSVKTAFGMGAPPVEEAAAEIAEPEPAKDEFKAPFNVAAVEDVRWPDGSPVRYAADRESGDISPMGLAFGNPYIIEKGMRVAEGLTGALTDALKGLARPPPGVGKPSSAPQVAPPQVVREIPSEAVDASTSAPEGDNNSGFPSI